MNDRVELTARSLLLGAAVTLVFTAANVYLGLKVGLTFASTIPAAVISMAVLRAFKNSSIYENNIVQTVASAAGTLSAVIFVLPGLIMIGWWSGFPFAQCFGVCAIGGILGVMYSVPLRRALVTQSSLPYPEGVAAAEVLKVGTAAGVADERNRAGLLALVGGTLASAGFAVIVATRIFAGQIAGYFRVGTATTGLGFSLSLALVGAGQLIGLSVGLAMLTGLFIAWGIATPVLTALHPAAGPAADVATTVWSHQVRFIGAGAIGVAALWSLGRLARPVGAGVASARAASRRRRLGETQEEPRTERDLPIGIVALISVACLIPLAFLLANFLAGGRLTPIAGWLTLAAVIYVVIAGFFVAAACGYMAGLIGSSNSPVSGLAILVVIGASLMLLVIARFTGVTAPSELIAYALFVTAVLLCVATISNDNLQDLKTGQLVDATPWRQQVALVFGVAVGALVIPPILNLLNRGYGFAGAPNLHNAIAQPLPAPQATLISALAKGVIGGQIDWSLIATGALVGAIVVAADELLRTTKRAALPPLAVGLGIYLPASTTAPVVVGAVIGWLYNRWAARAGDVRAKQIGVLIASGLIVGESLFGVLLAGLIVSTGRPEPLGLVGDAFAKASTAIGAVAFVVVLGALFRWAGTLSRSCASSK
ncbi:MAG: oligopeptide transporter, OPT family [Candidatus Cybelea sp.]